MARKISYVDYYVNLLGATLHMRYDKREMIGCDDDDDDDDARGSLEERRVGWIWGIEERVHTFIETIRGFRAIS